MSGPILKQAYLIGFMYISPLVPALILMYCTKGKYVLLKPLENTRFYKRRNNPEVTQGTLVSVTLGTQ
jgi:hypothetical protein